MKKFSLAITNNYDIAIFGLCITLRIMDKSYIKDTNLFITTRKDKKLNLDKEEAFIKSKDGTFERHTKIIKILNIDLVKDSLKTNFIYPENK